MESQPLQTAINPQPLYKVIDIPADKVDLYWSNFFGGNFMTDDKGFYTFVMFISAQIESMVEEGFVFAGGYQDILAKVSLHYGNDMQGAFVFCADSLATWGLWNAFRRIREKRFTQEYSLPPEIITDGHSKIFKKAENNYELNDYEETLVKSFRKEHQKRTSVFNDEDMKIGYIYDFSLFYNNRLSSKTLEAYTDSFWRSLTSLENITSDDRLLKETWMECDSFSTKFFKLSTLYEYMKERVKILKESQSSQFQQQ